MAHLHFWVEHIKCVKYVPSFSHLMLKVDIKTGMILSLLVQKCCISTISHQLLLIANKMGPKYYFTYQFHIHFLGLLPAEELLYFHIGFPIFSYFYFCISSLYRLFMMELIYSASPWVLTVLQQPPR